MKIYLKDPVSVLGKIMPLICFFRRYCGEPIDPNSPGVGEGDLNYLKIISEDGVSVNAMAINPLNGTVLIVSLEQVQIEGAKSFSIVVPASLLYRLLVSSPDIVTIERQQDQRLIIGNHHLRIPIKEYNFPPYDCSISSDVANCQSQLSSSYDELQQIYKKVRHLNGHLLLSCKDNNLEYFSAKDKEIIYGRISKKHSDIKILLNINSLDIVLSIIDDSYWFSSESKEDVEIIITCSKKDNFKITTFQCEEYQFQHWEELVTEDIELFQTSAIKALSQFEGIYKTADALEFIKGLITINPDNKEINLEFSSDNLSASICYPNQDKLKFPLQKVWGISILGKTQLDITIDSQYLINGLNSISDEWFLMILNEFNGKKSMIIQSINFDSGQTYSNSQIEEIIETSKSGRFIGCRYVAQW